MIVVFSDLPLKKWLVADEVKKYLLKIVSLVLILTSFLIKFNTNVIYFRFKIKGTKISISTISLPD